MTGRLQIHDTPINALKVVQRHVIGDHRGYLERLFCSQELVTLLAGNKRIAQVNHTLTVQLGTVRGLHFQHPPHAEIKFVSCVKGAVFDVAVDLRRKSETFLHWHAETLTPDNHKTFVIPEGFAHGFQTLTNNAEMLYLHTVAHEPGAEDGLNPQDPRLNIHWPEAVTELSVRDAEHPLLTDAYSGVVV